MLSQKHKLPLCGCGCGQFTNFRKGKFNRFIHGHSRRGKHHTIEAKRKVSEANKGKCRSSEVRKRMSEAH